VITAKRISVIIPVLNEASIINLTLGQFPNVTPSSTFEIIVVDGDKSGSTINVITHPGVKTAIAPIGRAIQMNHGAAIASGKNLLFLHSDTLLPENALEKINILLSLSFATCGAFELGIRSSKPIYRFIERMVGIRTRITGIPYGDQAIFLTTELFNQVGGYPDIPIMEDIALMRRLRKRKACFRMIAEKVSTSPRRWETEGLVYCTIRNLLMAISFLLGANPKMLAKYYRFE
jgi:rSAM/selenodomain-associated transferase 2